MGDLGDRVAGSGMASALTRSILVGAHSGRTSQGTFTSKQTSNKGVRMARLRWRAIALSVAAAMLAFACGGSQNGSSQQLAGNQTYSFPLVTGGEISTLDPGHVNDAVSISFVDEMFGKLLRFDRNHKVVPQIARSLP